MRALKRIFFSIVLLAVIFGGGWLVHKFHPGNKNQIDEAARSQQLVSEGEYALNIGRYEDAKRIFSHELIDYPDNKQAALGLKKAQAKEISSLDGFKAAVDELYKENPYDAHVILFLGEYNAAIQQYDDAIKLYEKAAEYDPKLAEAHFELAILYLKLDRLEAAKVACLKAIALSNTPKYRNNLAAIYLKQKRYDAAVKEYGRNQEYPLSALEIAKVFWRLGYLSQSLNYQRIAIEGLESPRIMNKPDNQDAWYFEISPEKTIKLGTLDEKKSYAYLSLAVSLFFQGDTNDAQSQIDKLKTLNVPLQNKIDSLIKYDLNTLVPENIDYASYVVGFKQLYPATQ